MKRELRARADRLHARDGRDHGELDPRPDPRRVVHLGGGGRRRDLAAVQYPESCSYAPLYAYG